MNRSWRAYENLHCQGSRRTRRSDPVVVEEPLEIRIGDAPIAVLMRTPGQDDELTAGFLLTEGVIGSADDLLDLGHCRAAAPSASRGNIMVVEVPPTVGVDLERLRRNFYASSSCGICGKASIEQVRRRCAPIADSTVVSREVLQTLPDLLRSRQRVFAATGGLHAAGLFEAAGRMLCVREDVGRHNAVDKVIGWAALEGREVGGCVLQVSGRASFEIVQKALGARIPIVATVSAPSSLAVDLARSANMTLVSFVRGENMAVFSGEERIGGTG